jgi:TPR repeat protein
MLRFTRFLRPFVAAVAMLLAAHCGAQNAGVVHPAPALSSAPADAFATRPTDSPHCTPDVKDVTPCTEDCNRGLASACVTAALRAEHGEGMPVDLTRAAALQERACDLRDVAACLTASKMAAAGRGSPPNRKRQLEWLEKACALSDGAACSVASKAFLTGAGVPRDVTHGQELLQRACAASVESACEAVESSK